MGNENSNSQAKTPSENRDQILPDGIGLSVENVRALLASQHNTSVPKDDPMLMVVTIMNAALTEQAKLQDSHEKALGKMMTQHTANYVKNTEKGMAEIMATLSALTTKGINEAIKDMVKFRTTMIYCAAITFLSSLLIVGAFVLKALKG